MCSSTGHGRLLLLPLLLMEMCEIRAVTLCLGPRAAQPPSEKRARPAAPPVSALTSPQIAAAVLVLADLLKIPPGECCQQSGNSFRREWNAELQRKPARTRQ